MAKKVRMADIAQQVGVSTVTVSEALAGKNGVSEAMREKIMARPRKWAIRSQPPLPWSMGEMVGVLITERFLRLNESFYWTMYERILDKLTARGMFGMIERVSLRDEAEKTVPMLVQSKRIQAIIVIGSFALDYLQMIR